MCALVLVAGAGCTPHSRLHSPRHYQPVRGAGGGRQQSTQPLLSPPSARRVHRLPQFPGAPLSREIHLIWESNRTHKHPAVKQWLAAHTRFHLHFTPTGASWLNLVERWFAPLAEQAIRRGSFDSVRRPEQAIARWLEKWNQNARPFRWTKSAADIKRSISNAALIYDTGH